mmetsp:Transcript_12919/g.27907  ORF Transcript_12919/g.27907 Transcript_12919/m.27907 type:complete len:298 (+) Transcript_12919:199-1092(+)
MVRLLLLAACVLFCVALPTAEQGSATDKQPSPHLAGITQGTGVPAVKEQKPGRPLGKTRHVPNAALGPNAGTRSSAKLDEAHSLHSRLQKLKSEMSSSLLGGAKMLGSVFSTLGAPMSGTELSSEHTEMLNWWCAHGVPAGKPEPYRCKRQAFLAKLHQVHNATERAQLVRTSMPKRGAHENQTAASLELYQMIRLYCKRAEQASEKEICKSSRGSGLLERGKLALAKWTSAFASLSQGGLAAARAHMPAHPRSAGPGRLLLSSKLHGRQQRQSDDRASRQDDAPHAQSDATPRVRR